MYVWHICIGGGQALCHGCHHLLSVLVEGVDLLEEGLLTAPQPECEGLEVFARCEVHLVREIVGSKRHVLGEGPLGVAQQGRLLGHQSLAKALDVLLLQGHLGPPQVQYLTFWAQKNRPKTIKNPVCAVK